MSSFTLYQVDAFADRAFTGNPAAVVPLDTWLPVELMQAIAGENNLSETAFFVREGDQYQIRWFTPTQEVPLCGHATLATAWVIFNHIDPDAHEASFSSTSGDLGVNRLDDGWLELDFPRIGCRPLETASVVQALGVALGIAPSACFSIAEDANTLVLLDSASAVAALTPDLQALKQLDQLGLGIIVTAPGDDCDFVSRYFAPRAGIDEDPVTGSTHSVLTPFWAERLGKRQMLARQLSARGGTLRCSLRRSTDGDRVGIAGQVAPYLEGEITLPDY